jgi:hypothetical protein
MANADLPIYTGQLPRLLSDNGVSVREDVLYTNAKGEPDDGSKKRAEKALVDLREVLPGLLEQNEAVLNVINSCQAPMGTLEQFVLSWHAYRVSATRLVFTNLRLLHFGMNSSGKWNRTLKIVRWGDVAEAEVKGWINRLLKLKYANGTKENYWRLRRKDGQKAKAILATVLPLSKGEATQAGGFQSICPDCRATLTPGHYRCIACGLTFKDEKTLLKRTLLIPGGGYLYAGITLLGAIAFFTEGIFAVAMIAYLLMAAGLLPAETVNDVRAMQRGELLTAALISAVIVALHKALEYIHSRRVIRTFLPLKRP